MINIIVVMMTKWILYPVLQNKNGHFYNINKRGAFKFQLNGWSLESAFFSGVGAVKILKMEKL